jgi:hypothetical protein
MLGRLPKKNGEEYKECIIELDEKMNDEEILEKVKYYLDNKNEKKLNELKIKGKEIGEKYFTYSVGVKYMERILDEISKN